MKIRTKLFFGFGILLIVILLVTGVAYFNSIKIINSAGGIVHTENVLRTLEEINSQLVDAETGQRGYILTREESYLEPYNEAILKIIENLKYLKELTSDNPVQQKNIEMVEPLIKARLKGLRKTIRLKRNGKDDLVMSIVLENEGKKLMDDIREITSSMKVEENRLLGERSQMPEESRKESNLILLFLFIFGGVVGVGTSFIIARKIANPIKQLQKATEQVGKGNFKVRTNIKTRDEVRQLAIAFDKTTEALERMDEEHKQLEKAKTEFLSITSHELRSPMTPMRAQLQMLLGEYFGKLNTKQKESMKIVLRNTERLDNIIVDFLEISRIEAARLKFNFKKVDPIEGVNCLVEEMNGFLPEKKIKIKKKLGKLPIIEHDPDRLSQVLRNLINNAKKFSPEESTITLAAKREENLILFSVKDQGIGLEPKDQRRIFEPFYQVGGMYQRRSGGTGLGLAICKGIIESQNGKIWLESTKGKGTTFYFTVPLKPVKQGKPIKLLFSPLQDIEKKVKELLIEYLGPLGTSEFETLIKKGLDYKQIIDYIQFLRNKSIIDAVKAKEMVRNIQELYGIKQKRRRQINLPKEIRKVYVENLGVLGEKRFKKFNQLSLEEIIKDINKLEKTGVVDQKQAIKFRDEVNRLFKIHNLGGIEAERVDPSELIEVGFVSQDKTKVTAEQVVERVGIGNEKDLNKNKTKRSKNEVVE